MTRSTPSARPNSGLLRSRGAICLLMAVAAGTSCADDGTQPDDWSEPHEVDTEGAMD